jgi:hypothetical protein
MQNNNNNQQPTTTTTTIATSIQFVSLVFIDKLCYIADCSAFVRASELYGRSALNEITAEVWTTTMTTIHCNFAMQCIDCVCVCVCVQIGTKSLQEVKDYAAVFWKKYKTITGM